MILLVHPTQQSSLMYTFTVLTDHALGGCKKQNKTQCHGKDHFMAIRNGEIPFLPSKGIMEKLLCVGSEEFSWTPIDGQTTLSL